MRKNELIALIQHNLAGGDMVADLEARYHENIIAKYAEMAMSGILEQVQKQTIHYKDWGQLDSYTKTFVAQPILLDSTRDEYYSVLPARVVNLYRNRGVRFVSYNKDQSTKFLYRDNNSTDVYSELEVSLVDNRPTFYVEKGKVFYDKISDKEELIAAGALMKLIVPFGDLDDEDDVGIPAGQEPLLVEMILKLMKGMAPEDVLNDNNSKQV